MENDTRRAFTKKAGIATAYVAGSFLNLNPRAKGANEKVVLALIGGRNQGRGDALRAIRQGGQIKTFCDIDQAILDKVGVIRRLWVGFSRARNAQRDWCRRLGVVIRR